MCAVSILQVEWQAKKLSKLPKSTQGPGRICYPHALSSHPGPAHILFDYIIFGEKVGISLCSPGWSWLMVILLPQLSARITGMRCHTRGWLCNPDFCLGYHCTCLPGKITYIFLSLSTLQYAPRCLSHATTVPPCFMTTGCQSQILYNVTSL